MKFLKHRFLFMPAILGSAFLVLSALPLETAENDIIAYQVDPKTQSVKLYWKDKNGEKLGSLGNLKKTH